MFLWKVWIYKRKNTKGWWVGWYENSNSPLSINRAPSSRRSRRGWAKSSVPLRKSTNMAAPCEVVFAPMTARQTVITTRIRQISMVFRMTILLIDKMLQ